VRLWKKWRADLKELSVAEDTLHAWYTVELSWLKDLQLADVPSDRWSPAGWRAAVNEAVNRRPEEKYPPDHPLPEAETLPIPRGEAITFAAAYRFKRAAAAADDWRQSAVRLADLRDLADAVGFTTNPAVKDAAVLRLPQATDSREAVGWAVGTFAELKVQYPRAAAGDAAWVMNPDAGPLQRKLGERLQEVKANAMELVKRLVANDPAVKAGEWDKLAAADGLLLKPELAAWGELLRLLVRWADPTQPDDDPVKHLAAFVAKKEFTWQVDRIRVNVPNTAIVNTPLDRAGDLTIRAGTGVGARGTTFTPGRPMEVAGTTVIEFTPTRNGDVIRYQRGETFAAAVTLIDAKGLTIPIEWAGTDARTPSFQFTAFDRELRQPAGVTATVTVRSGSAEFRVPLLLPEVK
jgi:hypothetical protein